LIPGVSHADALSIGRTESPNSNIELLEECSILGRTERPIKTGKSIDSKTLAMWI
jgi:hypothetical protein